MMQGPYPAGGDWLVDLVDFFLSFVDAFFRQSPHLDKRVEDELEKQRRL